MLYNKDAMSRYHKDLSYDHKTVLIPSISTIKSFRVSIGSNIFYKLGLHNLAMSNFISRNFNQK